MRLKIRASKLAGHPIWKVTKEDGEKYDFWDKETVTQNKDGVVTISGVTKDELVDILHARGHLIIQ